MFGVCRMYAQYKKINGLAYAVYAFDVLSSPKPGSVYFGGVLAVGLTSTSHILKAAKERWVSIAGRCLV